MKKHPLNSAIYKGWVKHRRTEPPSRFRLPIYMTYLDLDEVNRLFRISPLWSRKWWAPVQFRERDYFDHKSDDLANAIRDLVEAELGFRPNGPVRMLTHLRTFYWLFNPLTIYWCFDGDSEADAGNGEAAQDRHSEPVAMVAEVSNTPWKERCHYVLPIDSSHQDSEPLARVAKKMHVSPFFPMNQEYEFIATRPGNKRMRFKINLYEDDERVFWAGLNLKRVEMSKKSMSAILWKYPAETIRVSAGIYIEAFKLWRRGASYHRHPNHKKNRAA